MASVVITKTGAEWNVWIGLTGDDPVQGAFGFIVGSGSSRDAAVADAVQDLEATVARLQEPPGAIEERERAPIGRLPQ